MLSQLNYRASAYLNDGTEPRRLPFGAHSYYVPAQLFPTAEGYLALFVTHDGFWRSFAAEAGIAGFLTMAERAARREEVLPRWRTPWPPTPPRPGSPGSAGWVSRPRPCARCRRRWPPLRT
jgi:CoA:oxalate CoA-transferase